MRALNELTIDYALTGSLCTLEKSAGQMRRLIDEGHRLIPIMSETAFSTDTRSGRAQDWNQKIEELCNHKIWHTIVQVEPIGPRRLVGSVLVAPCTKDTLAKMAHGATGIAVTMAARSHLGVGEPALLAISTNGALSATTQNVGRLMSTKHIYFVPMARNDSKNKPNSVVSDFSLLPVIVLSAVQDKQMQPILLQK